MILACFSGSRGLTAPALSEEVIASLEEEGLANGDDFLGYGDY
jgi:hypothetical protein